MAVQFYGGSGRSLKGQPVDVFNAQTVQSTMEKVKRARDNAQTVQSTMEI